MSTQTSPYARSFPASAPESAHWTDRVVTQGHADYCAANGHATWTVEGVDQQRCPRCGESTAPMTDVPDVHGAYLESHEYDSFPKPVPFWIVRCNHASHGPISLNSGHHYREDAKHHAELLIIRHDRDEHPLVGAR